MNAENTATFSVDAALRVALARGTWVGTAAETRRASRTAQEKIYRARMTREAWIFLSIVGAAVLLATAQTIVLALEGQRAVALSLLLVEAAVILGASLFTAFQLSTSIRITPTVIELRQGGRRTVVAWSNIRELTPPKPGNHMFRFVSLSDGRFRIRFDSYAFREFNLLVNLITVARHHRATENNGYR